MRSSFPPCSRSSSILTRSALDLIVFTCRPAGPVISGCPNSVVIPAYSWAAIADYSWTPPCITDVTSTALYITASSLPGEFFNVGTTTVTYTAVSVNTETSATCSFDVVVADLTPPTVSCPLDMAVPTDAGQAFATVPVEVVSSFDNVGVVNLTLSAPDNVVCDAGLCRVPLGSFSLQYTARDEASNNATCSFSVVVSDAEPPTFEGCPAEPLLARASDSGDSAIVSLPAITAHDNSGEVMQTVDRDLADHIFHLGTTSVLYYASDAAGNSALCNVTVVVRGLSTGLFCVFSISCMCSRIVSISMIFILIISTLL